MPLRNDLLDPIPGEIESGPSLRYDKIYDQIKEARTEEDSTLPAGAWERQIKKADFNLALKLAGEALAKRSKDLQLAVWLGEAHLKREGISLLAPVLTLLLDLQQRFWDTLHPEVDDGDAGLRVVPLQWASNRYSALVRETPLTRTGINFNEHKTARSIGYEQDADTNDARRAARAEAVAAGRITAETFDTAFSATPKSFYAELESSLLAAADTIDPLSVYCEQQYGEDGPSFRKLRESIEEVQHLVSSLLNDKRKFDPDPAIPPTLVPEEPPPEPAYTTPGRPEPHVSAPPPPPPMPAPVSVAPSSPQSAIEQIRLCSGFLAAHAPQSPIPYLLNTAIRWGELRAAGRSPDGELLAAPPTELRQKLRRLLFESSWTQLLSDATNALAEPCGRAWLDLHRYLWTASQQLGYDALASTIVGSLQSLLKDLPRLTSWSLTDDTPTANAETQRWLEQHVLPPPPPEPQLPEPPPIPLLSVLPVATAGEASSSGPPDPFELANDLVRRGDLQAAIQMLTTDALQQPSGRMRYRRKLEIAQLCLTAGNTGVAAPILQQLIDEIEQRNLESWESGELIARPLSLLLQCMNGNSDAADRKAVFSRLCRIDPTAALRLLS